MTTLQDHGIHIKNPHPGENRTACPECAKLKARARDDALQVLVEPDGATWRCYRCGWTGGFKHRSTNGAAGANGAAPSKARRAATFEAITPAPREPTTRDLRHHKLGEPTGTWRYLDPDDRLLFVQRRFDLPDGQKEFRPLTYGRLNGRAGWHDRAPASPRPMYGSELLGVDPQWPVVIVEGEKSADRARTLGLMPLVITAMNGANQAHMTDWTPIKNRACTIWPDNDEPGRKFAEHVAQLVTDAGAATVQIVKLPAGLPAGWDLGDPLPPGWSNATVAGLIETARPWQAAAPNAGGPDFVKQDTFIVVRRAAHDPPGKRSGPVAIG